MRSDSRRRSSSHTIPAFSARNLPTTPAFVVACIAVRSRASRRCIPDPFASNGGIELISIRLMICPLQGTATPPRLCATSTAGDNIAAFSRKNRNRRDLNVSSTLTQNVPGASRLRSKDAAPVVAVSATADTRLGGAHRVRLNSSYIIALESAGLVPVVIPPLASPEQARAILERVDGVLLTGGEDVDPALYGQDRAEKCGAPNRARDETEIALAAAAHELGK